MRIFYWQHHGCSWVGWCQPLLLESHHPHVHQGAQLPSTLLAYGVSSTSFSGIGGFTTVSPLDPEKGVTSGVSRETDSTWLLWTNIQAIQTTCKNSRLALIRIAWYSWSLDILPTLGTAVDPLEWEEGCFSERSVIGDHRSYQRMGWTGEVSEITQTSSRDSR